MRKSSFICGLAQEDGKAVEAQAVLWDDSTVWEILWKLIKDKTSVDEAFASFVAQRLPTLSLAQTSLMFALDHPLDPQAMKLCRLLDNIGESISAAPNAAVLHDLGSHIERNAIAKLRGVNERSIADRLRRAKRGGFDGETTEDLVRHVILNLFAELEASFKDKPREERERLAAQIADALNALDEDTLDRIKDAAQMHDFSTDALLRSGGIAGLGIGLSTVVGVTGFSAYTAVTSVMAAVAGAVGVTLPFSAYLMATSMLAFMTNPIVLLAGLGGAGWWLTQKANNQIRARLTPILVTTAVISQGLNTEHQDYVTELAAHMARRYKEFLDSSGETRRVLKRAFPAFVDPTEKPIAHELVDRVVERIPQIFKKVRIG
jgi:hypothetical protein